MGKEKAKSLNHGGTQSVAVFGGGIAGLSAAHELASLGYHVRVYEASPEAGGFFRSARLPENGNTPSEYSWHGMGPWYHNTFDLLKKIPFDETGSLYDRAISRPIDFGIFPDSREARFYEKSIRQIPRMFEMSYWDWVKWFWVMFKTWTSNDRTVEHYSRLNAALAWGAVLRPRAHRVWRSCFGPWIGSDWTRVSLHTAGQFFRKQLISKPTHYHSADSEGAAWSQGAGDGWLLFKGPSSEFWFDPWVRYLREQGVEFYWNSPLHKLQSDGESVHSAITGEGENVQADYYIVATDPFAAREIIDRSPGLASEPELLRFENLIQDGPHVQVSFRLAFAEPIHFPRERTAIVVADSEFNLTLFAEEQVWDRNVDLGANTESLWTGTSCVSSEPGRLTGLPVERCTREQFIAEVLDQILNCESLDTMVREANSGRSLSSFPLLRVEVWHEWEFGPEGIKSPRPKWVTTTNTQAWLPNQTTGIANLFLAGAHTKTAADVWSIEGAVESGRLAAKGIDPQVSVLPQYNPLLLRALARLDDGLYSLRLPHLLDCFGAVLVLVATFGLFELLRRI